MLETYMLNIATFAFDRENVELWPGSDRAIGDRETMTFGSSPMAVQR